MLVLGIESTCDETGCALVVDGKTILSNQVSSQIAEHARYGGVVPELASRRHIETCIPLLTEALKEAGCTVKDIDLISVANGPGLIGALLVGLNFAKGLAIGLEKPLVGVNHVQAHLYACSMEAAVQFPAIGCVISGGHTALLHMESIDCYKLIGQTHDDAVGEAFDKVAAMLGLPYPGGPEVEKLALKGDPNRFAFKPGTIKDRPLDFSFSGLKTAVLYKIKEVRLTDQTKADIAASFQKVACEVIVKRALLAAKSLKCQSVLLGGGVSNNGTLRQMFTEQARLPLFWPPKGLTLDNAAMIAGLGYHLYKRRGHSDSLDLEAFPRIPL